MKKLVPLVFIKLQVIILIPEAIFFLFIYRIKVSFFSSKHYILSTSSVKRDWAIQADKIVTGQNIAYVINGLSKRTPWRSTCLIKALAAHRMLRKRVIPHQISYGLKKDSSDVYHAHAWLTINKIALIGGDNIDEYTEIAKFSY